MKSIENLSSNSNEGSEDLGTLDLSDLKKSLEDYNKQFSFGTLLAKHIIESVEGKDTDEDKELYKPKILIKDIENRHRNIINKTGISVESIRKGIMFTGNDEEKQLSEVRINLRDGKIFLSYLNSLSENDIKESQITGLKLVADSLTKQLVEQYELDNPNDERMLELFGSVDDIIKEYKRLGSLRHSGLSESVNDLSEYLSMARKKYLREYLIAKKNHLLGIINSYSFGPEEWHRDESSYEKYWGDAIKKVNLIGMNQNASDLYKQVVRRLRDVLAVVKEDITEGFYGFKNDSKKTKNYLRIIDKYSGILEDM